MHEVASASHMHKGIGDIALSLSGGGVRAVGFHLGTLDMLERLELLPRVRILSTVSGGSLTGTGYALAQQLGYSFDRYFNDFYDFLPQLNTIEQLLHGLADPASPSPSGRRDMITVMANIYDEFYFRKYFGQPGSDGPVSPRFDILLDDGKPGSHLGEIIFNATEFQTGTGFRFQRSDSRCLIGNANIFLCTRHARDIRMADIMAASSCIPVGMEPLFFPHDFHWSDDPAGPGGPRPTCDEIRTSLQKNLSAKFALYRDRKVDFFALMDGGVYDNQGIVSVLLAMNRRAQPVKKTVTDDCYCGKSLYEAAPPPGPDQWVKWLAGRAKQGEDERQAHANSDAHNVGLIIISDTPVRKDSLYPKVGQAASGVETAPFSNPYRKPGRLEQMTIGGLDRLGWLLAVVLLASAGLTFYQEIWPNRDWTHTDWLTIVDDVLQVLVPLALTAGLGILLFRARRALRDVAHKLKAVLPPDRWQHKDPWQYMKGLRVRDLAQMVGLRVGSVSALTASVFMERIRSLVYGAAYLRESLENHIVPNQIFALEKTAKGQLLDWPDGLSAHANPISEDASAIVSMAAHMPTKLWINRVRHKEYTHAGMPELSQPLAAATEQVCRLNDARIAAGKTPLNDLDVLVMCGQMTICYRLMRHLWKSHGNDGRGFTDADSERIFLDCCKHWNRLVADPACLLDERRARAA